jgi:ABC-type antimicrobial peptide transport system permease subunit
MSAEIWLAFVVGLVVGLVGLLVLAYALSKKKPKP